MGYYSDSLADESKNNLCAICLEEPATERCRRCRNRFACRRCFSRISEVCDRCLPFSAAEAIRPERKEPTA